MSREILFDWCLVLATVVGIVALTCYVLVEERRHADRRIRGAATDGATPDVPTSLSRGPEDDPAWLAYSRDDLEGGA